MTPTEYYQHYCQTGRIQADSDQWLIIEKLEHIYVQLIAEVKRRASWKKYFQPTRLIKGLYVWGGVGVGKTFLMDCFYQALPFPQKMRMHFLPFLQRIHQELTQHQGEADPLQVIAKDIAAKTHVLCFDEFVVNDVTDAMLLGRLLTALFRHGVCLVTTSNIAPDNLYQYGLQRLQFLPTIALIKQYTDVIHIPSRTDYRLRHLREAGVFYSPLNAESYHHMEKTVLYCCAMAK